MKDLGELHYCLGINITHDEDGIVLHQKQYITSLLERFGLTEAKTVSTQVDLNVQLVKHDGVSKEVDSVKYQSMVGSLFHDAMATRPDIGQAVGAVSKSSSKPT